MTQEVNHDPRPYGERKLYWPFETLPPERRTEQHQREIRFFETAYQEGYKPYTDVMGNFGGSSSQRAAWSIVGGRRRWEVLLWTRAQETLHEVASAYPDDFDCAAAAVLQWLRGDSAADILGRIREHLVVLPGASRSFVLYDEQEKEKLEARNLLGCLAPPSQD